MARALAAGPGPSGLLAPPTALSPAVSCNLSAWAAASLSAAGRQQLSLVGPSRPVSHVSKRYPRPDHIKDSVLVSPGNLGFQPAPVSDHLEGSLGCRHLLPCLRVLHSTPIFGLKTPPLPPRPPPPSLAEIAHPHFTACFTGRIPLFSTFLPFSWFQHILVVL